MNLGQSKILLDERWLLEDFSVLTKEYMQLYGFFYSLRKMNEEPNYNIEFESRPWLGGGSVVGFFSFLGKTVKPLHKPEVKSIQYASPGFIELTLIVEVAKDIGILIAALSGSIASAAGTYNLIHSQYQKRRLTQLKIKDLEQMQLKNEIEFVKKSVRELYTDFQLTNGQVKALVKLTKGDELIQLKILLALYRRAKPIASLQNKNKASFRDA